MVHNLNIYTNQNNQSQDTPRTLIQQQQQAQNLQKSSTNFNKLQLSQNNSKENEQQKQIPKNKPNNLYSNYANNNKQQQSGTPKINSQKMIDLFSNKQVVREKIQTFFLSKQQKKQELEEQNKIQSPVEQQNFIKSSTAPQTIEQQQKQLMKNDNGDKGDNNDEYMEFNLNQNLRNTFVLDEQEEISSKVKTLENINEDEEMQGQQGRQTANNSAQNFFSPNSKLTNELTYYQQSQKNKQQQTKLNGASTATNKNKVSNVPSGNNKNLKVSGNNNNQQENKQAINKLSHSSYTTKNNNANNNNKHVAAQNKKIQQYFESGKRKNKKSQQLEIDGSLNEKYGCNEFEFNKSSINFRKHIKRQSVDNIQVDNQNKIIISSQNQAAQQTHLDNGNIFKTKTYENSSNSNNNSLNNNNNNNSNAFNNENHTDEKETSINNSNNNNINKTNSSSTNTKQMLNQYVTKLGKGEILNSPFIYPNQNQKKNQINNVNPINFNNKQDQNPILQISSQPLQSSQVQGQQNAEMEQQKYIQYNINLTQNLQKPLYDLEQQSQTQTKIIKNNSLFNQIQKNINNNNANQQNNSNNNSANQQNNSKPTSKNSGSTLNINNKNNNNSKNSKNNSNNSNKQSVSQYNNQKQQQQNSQKSLQQQQKQQQKNNFNQQNSDKTQSPQFQQSKQGFFKQQSHQPPQHLQNSAALSQQQQQKVDQEEDLDHNQFNSYQFNDEIIQQQQAVYEQQIVQETQQKPNNKSTNQKKKQVNEIPKKETQTININLKTKQKQSQSPYQFMQNQIKDNINKQIQNQILNQQQQQQQLQQKVQKKQQQQTGSQAQQQQIEEQQSVQDQTKLIQEEQQKQDKQKQQDQLQQQSQINNPVKKISSQRKPPTFEYYNTNMEMHMRYPNENDYFNQMYREHFIQNYNSLAFCKNLDLNNQEEYLKRQVFLEKKNPQMLKTIVFDLDETLIHCNENPDIVSDVILPIQFPSDEVIDAGINVRPYVKEMLMELSEICEIIVFTASHECYASKVIDHLDPEKKYVHHRLFRDQCVTTEEGVHIKDLRILANRDLKDIVLVDNAAYSFGYQINNGIPIIPYYDNKADQELRFLTDYLKYLVNNNDVREYNKHFFKMEVYAESETPEKALEDIYGVKANSIL